MDLKTKISKYSLSYWLYDNKDFIKSVLVLLMAYATTTLDAWQTENAAMKVLVLGLVALVGKKLIDTLDYLTPDLPKEDTGTTKL